MTAKQIIIIYLIAINSITFFLYGIDKWKAKRSKWRIPNAVSTSVMTYHVVVEVMNFLKC